MVEERVKMILHRLIAFQHPGVVHSDVSLNSEEGAYIHANRILSENHKLRIDYRLETYENGKLVESKYQGEFTWESDTKQPKKRPYPKA